MIAIWVEGGSITGAVFEISMYPAGPMKFCQICQSTNFYLYLPSKAFMTVLHQNMTNDRAPPKYEVLSDLPINQFLIFIRFLSFRPQIT